MPEQETNRQFYTLLELVSQKKSVALAFTCWFALGHLGAHAFYLERQRLGLFYVIIAVSVLAAAFGSIAYQEAWRGLVASDTVVGSYMQYKSKFGTDPFQWIVLGLSLIGFLRWLLDGLLILPLTRRHNEKIDRSIRSKLGLVAYVDPKEKNSDYKPPEDVTELVSRLYKQDPVTSKRN